MHILWQEWLLTKLQQTVTLHEHKSLPDDRGRAEIRESACGQDLSQTTLLSFAPFCFLLRINQREAHFWSGLHRESLCFRRPFRIRRSRPTLTKGLPSRLEDHETTGENNITKG